MGIILKIAWRNLFRHKGKSIIIGTIIFFAALMMTMGNGVMEGMSQNLHQNLAERFLGDIALVSADQDNESVLFDEIPNLPEIVDYFNIKAALSQETQVQDFLPIALGFGLLLENDERQFLALLGVNFEDYQRFFGSNVVMLEGSPLKNSERGILFSDEWRDRVYEMQGYWVAPEGVPPSSDSLPEGWKGDGRQLDRKTNLVVMGISQSVVASDIRIPVRGIHKFKDYNFFWGYFNIIDIESFRESFNYQTAQDSAAEISGDKKKLLSMESANIEDMFGGEMIAASGKKTDVDYSTLRLKKNPPKAVNKANLEEGAYNFICIKLRKGVDTDREITRLNNLMKEKKLGAKAISWKSSGGSMVQGTNIFSSVIFFFVLFLYFVVIIVIMNTLNMAVIERTQEIAMMRSVGSRKSFIGRLLFSETAILSLIFGGLGVIIGTLLVWLFAALGITVTDQEMAAIFFASDKFRPVLGFQDILFCFLELILFTSVAVFYPIKLALRISPLEAIAKE